MTRIRHKVLLTIGILLAVLLAVVLADFLYIKYAGSPVLAPNISREPRLIGEGKPLSYVILGDSRVVGQGGEYEKGVAVNAAKHLAKDHQVTFYNFGVSGARAYDVLWHQLPQAMELKPDFVVIYVGANDVNHLTDRSSVQGSITQAIEGLIAANCDTKIVLTDAAAMWSVPRVPHPLRYIAGVRSKQFNSDFKVIAGKYNLTFAPISDETAEAFVRDRTNFAADKFHPSDHGYALLSDALQPYLDQALTQPPHCK